MLDNNNTGHEPEYLAIFMCTILAALGGVARELSNFDTCFNLRRFLSNIFVAGFAGCLVGLAAPEFEHKNIVMICAGISGLMGCAIIDYLTAIFKAIMLHVASKTVGHTIEVKERAKRIHKNKKKTK